MLGFGFNPTFSINLFIARIVWSQARKFLLISLVASSCLRRVRMLEPFFFLSLQDADNVWWDAFAAEFFDDDATLTLSFCLEDGPKRYCMSDSSA